MKLCNVWFIRTGCILDDYPVLKEFLRNAKCCTFSSIYESEDKTRHLWVGYTFHKNNPTVRELQIIIDANKIVNASISKNLYFSHLDFYSIGNIFIEIAIDQYLHRNFTHYFKIVGVIENEVLSATEIKVEPHVKLLYLKSRLLKMIN